MYLKIGSLSPGALMYGGLPMDWATDYPVLSIDAYGHTNARGHINACGHIDAYGHLDVDENIDVLYGI